MHWLYAGRNFQKTSVVTPIFPKSIHYQRELNNKLFAIFALPTGYVQLVFRIIMTPFSFEEEVKKHPLKLLKSSFEAISDFSSPQSFKIVEPKDYPISNCEISISKKDNSQVFDFNMKLKNPISSDNFNYEYLGFDKSILIESAKNQRFASKDAVTSKSFALKDFQTLKGELSELNSLSKQGIKNRFLRIIIPTKNEAHTTLITSTSYKDKETIYGSGLVTIGINGNKYQMFRYKQKDEKRHYLVVDCLNTSDFDTFYNDSDCILKAFSLICGNWYGDQRYILTSADSLFEKIESVHFLRDSYSLITGYQIIDPFDFTRYMKVLGHKNVKVSENTFPSEVFSNMSQKLQNGDELGRALFLILEGNKSKSTILKICSYLVALETLSALISKTNKEFFKPIKKSQISDNLKRKIKSVVQEFKDDIDEKEYETILKKTEYLNSPSNMDKIIKSFELYKIKLPKPMLELIRTRNLFLHGKTPYKEHLVRSKAYELGINSLKLQMLISTLFLKYCGYSGHIKNLAGYKLYQDNKNDKSFNIDDHVYYTI